MCWNQSNNCGSNRRICGVAAGGVNGQNRGCNGRIANCSMCSQRNRCSAFQYGYQAGFEAGKTNGYNNGYQSGYHLGYQAGYDAGYEVGSNSGTISCETVCRRVSDC